MADLHSLLTRVEAATGPDRELDNMIRCALYEPAKRGMWLPYTASLDAALALVEDIFPGCKGSLTFDAYVARAALRESGRLPVEGGAVTLPCAVLSALLRALIASTRAN